MRQRQQQVASEGRSWRLVRAALGRLPLAALALQLGLGLADLWLGRSVRPWAEVASVQVVRCACVFFLFYRKRGEVKNNSNEFIKIP